MLNRLLSNVGKRSQLRFCSSQANTFKLGIQSPEELMHLVNERHRNQLPRGSVINIIGAVRSQLDKDSIHASTPYMAVLKRVDGMDLSSASARSLADLLMDFMEQVPPHIVGQVPSLRMLFETSQMSKTSLFHDLIAEEIAKVTKNAFPAAAQRVFDADYVFQGLVAEAKAYCETGDLHEFTKRDTMRRVSPGGYTIRLMQPSFTHELSYIGDEINAWAAKQVVLFGNGAPVFEEDLKSGQTGLMTEDLCRLSNFGLEQSIKKMFAPLMDDLTAKLQPSALYVDQIKEALSTHAQVQLPEGHFEAELEEMRQEYVRMLYQEEQQGTGGLPPAMFEGAADKETDMQGLGANVRFTVDSIEERLLYVSEPDMRLRAEQERLLNGQTDQQQEDTPESDRVIVRLPQSSLVQVSIPLNAMDRVRMVAGTQQQSEDAKPVVIDVERGWGYLSMRGESPAAIIEERGLDYKFMLVGGGSSGLKRFMESVHLAKVKNGGQ